MSLVTPRFPETERSSVILPTVTCSSCSAPIPLSSLGEHVCQTPAIPRSSAKPPQISVPQTKQSVTPRGTPRQDVSHDALRSPFNEPSAYPSPQQASPGSIRPPFAGPSSTRSSPTEFSLPQRSSPNSLTPPGPPSAFGTRLHSPSPTNPFFPNPSGAYQPVSPEPTGMSTMTGGESGMAGVGRRAFAAAAWGVRAGVALSRQNQYQGENSTPHAVPHQPAHWQQQTSRPEMHHSQTAPIPQRPVPERSWTAEAKPPQRTQSAMSQRSLPPVVIPPSHARNKSSVSSLGSLGSSWTGPAKPSNKRDFFEKVKQLNRNGSVMSRTNSVSTHRSNEQKVSSSPDRSAFDLEDDILDEDLPSALPWASPEPGESPRLHLDIKLASPPRQIKVHQQYPATESADSTHSSVSSESGRNGTSGPESEEVVTPSQSFEGLAARAARGVDVRKDVLQQIGEEEEEKIDFDESPDKAWREFNEKTEGKMTSSSSASTITTVKVPNSASHPSHKRTPSQKSVSRPQAQTRSANVPQRKQKTCQKCGEAVGGSKRFVERDGVVLCETDWKKLYLPSCRKCNLPIEKSAVSSSDGQLKGKWHRACFNCTRCEKPFENDDFYVLNGNPWCQYHYHEKNQTLCASRSCRQPIEGPCVVLPGTNPLRFHPGHFKCDHRGPSTGTKTCRESMDNYYEIDGKMYCERHVGEGLKKTHKGGNEAKAEKRRTRLIDLSEA